MPSKDKASFMERFSSFTQAHTAFCVVAGSLLIAASLALLFWFTLFSGISGSADFIYAQF